jgi:hypothetical protein
VFICVHCLTCGLLNLCDVSEVGLLLLRWGETVSLWNWTDNGPFIHPLDDTLHE